MSLIILIRIIVFEKKPRLFRDFQPKTQTNIILWEVLIS